MNAQTADANAAAETAVYELFANNWAVAAFSNECIDLSSISDTEIRRLIYKLTLCTRAWLPRNPPYMNDVSCCEKIICTKIPYTRHGDITDTLKMQPSGSKLEFPNAVWYTLSGGVQTPDDEFEAEETIMSKKVSILIAILAAAIVVLLAVPIPKAALDDGGTREYAALTYRIVKWKKFYAYGTYEKTKVYFGKDLKKTLDELWAEEAEGIEHVFDAEITEINGSVVTVRPAAGTAEAASSDKIQFGTGNLERIGFNVGTVVRVTYRGGISETYPAQINAISWKNADDLRDRDFDGE